ncbi:MAG: HD domain-containing protein [Candidatus Shapirobacteria bacterium]
MFGIDLSKYEDLYDSFDGGHNRQHLIAVRNCALFLSKKYTPDKIRLVYIAATLHDIGLSVNREEHEIAGEKIIRSDLKLIAQLSTEDLKEICHAVLEHRASTGKPKTVVAKIISDADRGGGLKDPGEQFLRPYLYGKSNYPELSEDEQILRAAKHQSEKFASDSYGRRTYFPETEIRLQRLFDPIIKAYKNNDMEFFRGLIKPLKK